MNVIKTIIIYPNSFIEITSTHFTVVYTHIQIRAFFAIYLHVAVVVELSSSIS